MCVYIYIHELQLKRLSIGRSKSQIRDRPSYLIRDQPFTRRNTSIHKYIFPCSYDCTSRLELRYALTFANKYKRRIEYRYMSSIFVYAHRYKLMQIPMHTYM